VRAVEIREVRGTSEVTHERRWKTAGHAAAISTFLVAKWGKGAYNPLHSKLKFTKSPDRNYVLTPKSGAHFVGSTSKGETTGHLVFRFEERSPVFCEL
jgi:hypothetical protein